MQQMTMAASQQIVPGQVPTAVVSSLNLYITNVLNTNIISVKVHELIYTGVIMTLYKIICPRGAHSLY